MTAIDIRAKIGDIVKRIAPEVHLDAIGGGEDLRQALDIDSFDFLNLVMGIHRDLGVEIPEADYGKLRTLDALDAYLRDALTDRREKPHERT